MNNSDSAKISSTTRSRALWVLIASVLGVGTFFLVQPLTLEYIAHAQVKVTPFTLHLDYYDFTTNPAGSIFIKQVIARRSDGATVHVNDVFSHAGMQANETMRDIFLPDGERFEVYDGVQSVVKLPILSPKALVIRKEGILNPPSNCVLPTQTLVGYDTVDGYKTGMVKWPGIGTDERIITAWDAPALGCQTLQSRVIEKQPDGSAKIVTEGRTASFSVGEPDAGLFDVPQNYASVMPSQAMRREAERLRLGWTDKMQQEANMRDAGLLRQMHQPQ